jgi:hypothetical protein
MTKNFKQNNPAEAFISIAQIEAAAPVDADSIKAPDGYKLNPAFVEVKSRRLQLLLQPSVADALKAYARETETSMNDCVSEVLKDFLKQKGRL